MRADRLDASFVQLWEDAVRPRGGVGAIARPAGGDRGDGLDVMEPEPDGRTAPFERMAALDDAREDAAGETAAEMPAPLVVAPGSQSPGFGSEIEQIGKYELREKIGQGSFGVVYTARDTELDREVALKVLNPSHHGDHDALHRFLREARAAARIAHPGIVTVHDCGRCTPEGGEELAYIAMERLRGESVTTRLDRCGQMRPEEAAEVARQVASALEAAHRAEVLHRDLKPDNVFLVPDPAVPSGERVKVLDFGLAKIGCSRHTELGSVFGTPLYMSPEQCRSSGEIDERSDIYALGCILFELVTGRPPFEGAIYEVLEGHLRQEAPRAAELAPATTLALDALIARMLEKDPDDRPASMAEVRNALEEVIEETTGPEAPAIIEDDGMTEGHDTNLRLMAFHHAPSEWLEAPVFVAPLVLEETGARPRIEAAEAEAEAPAEVKAPAEAPPRRARPGRRPLALVAAITAAVALAGALSLMAARRGTGAAAGASPVPPPAAGSTIR
ncbi:MAG TPA: serine/threonine-protein kinase [Kofleriaceae bacterium]|nr:serine/threonine-protein kinase [Kofleriaceae bacterium]